MYGCLTFHDILFPFWVWDQAAKLCVFNLKSLVSGFLKFASYQRCTNNEERKEKKREWGCGGAEHDCQSHVGQNMIAWTPTNKFSILTKKRCNVDNNLEKESPN